MTLETGLLAALSAVTTALCWFAQIMYARLIKAEKFIEQLRKELNVLERENGANSAIVKMFRGCPKADCPFSMRTINCQNPPP
jgi:cell division protein FtsB